MFIRSQDETKTSRKQAIAIVLVVSTFICLIIYSRRKHITTSFNSEFPEKRILPEDFLPLSLKINSCEDPSLVFAKTHKTGSTTLLKVLKRHEERHLLHSKVPLLKFDTLPFPFVGGYPGSFRRELSIMKSNSTVGGSEDGRASFLTNHFRWNKDEVKKAMNPKTKYVTILRDPLLQFQSSFHFYYARYASGKKPSNPITCHKNPYLFVTSGRWVNISEYLSMAEISLNETVPWFFRSRNYQSYDLGLDPLNLGKDYALQQAKELDDTFHLVVILEHLLESLVLLKDLLCMEWREIIPLPRVHNAQYQKHEFSEREKRIVRKLTTQDQVLYDYFNATLWRKVDAYGREKMAKDVAKLEEIIRKAESNSRTRIEKTSSQTIDQVAQRTRKDDESETDILTPFLMEKLTGGENQSEIARDIARYMVENYGWCPTLN